MLLLQLMRAIQLSLQGCVPDGVIQEIPKPVVAVDHVREMATVKKQDFQLLACRERRKHSIGVAVHGDDDAAGAHLPVDLEVEPADVFRFDLLREPLQLDQVIRPVVFDRAIQLFANVLERLLDLNAADTHQVDEDPFECASFLLRRQAVRVDERVPHVRELLFVCGLRGGSRLTPSTVFLLLLRVLFSDRRFQLKRAPFGDLDPMSWVLRHKVDVFDQHAHELARDPEPKVEVACA